MNKNSLVSVIMPVFNSEKYLRKSVRSILDQTWKNIELIVVNDGSTDNTEKILNEISSKDSRLKFIYQENKGVRRLAETLNSGLELCTGDYVTMFPSDDVCELDRFESQVKAFEDKEVVLVLSKMNLIDENGKVTGIASPSNKEIKSLTDDKELFKSYIRRNFISQPTVIFKRSTLINIGGYQQKDYMYAEDYPTQMEFIGKGKWAFVDKNVANYRIHPGQMTNIHTRQMYKTDTLYRLRCIKYNKFNLSHDEKILLRKDVLYNFYHGFFRCGLSEWSSNNKHDAKKFFKIALIRGNRSTKFKSLASYILVSLGVSFAYLNYLSKFRSIT